MGSFLVKLEGRLEFKHEINTPKTKQKSKRKEI